MHCPTIMKIGKKWTRKSKKTSSSLKNSSKSRKADDPHIKPIKIYADESVNIAIVEGLKRRGVNAFSAKDLGKLGLTDEEQLKVAIQNQAVIFTHDTDFIKIAINKTSLRHNLCSPAKINNRRMHQKTKIYS